MKNKKENKIYEVNVWWCGTVKVEAKSEHEAREKAKNSPESYDDAQLDHIDIVG